MARHNCILAMATLVLAEIEVQKRRQKKKSVGEKLDPMMVNVINSGNSYKTGGSLIMGVW